MTEEVFKEQFKESPLLRTGIKNMKKGKKSIKTLLKLRNKTLPTYVTVLQLVRALNNEISDRQLRRMVSEGKIIR